jgi:putative transposase
MEIVRAMVRYQPRVSRFTAASEKLRIRLRELAEQRRRSGYRRLQILLEREGWKVNIRRVYRIYVEEKLVVRRRRRRRRVCTRAGVLLSPPTRPNET